MGLQGGGHTHTHTHAAVSVGELGRVGPAVDSIREQKRSSLRVCPAKRGPDAAGLTRWYTGGGGGGGQGDSSI